MVDEIAGATISSVNPPRKPVENCLNLLQDKSTHRAGRSDLWLLHGPQPARPL